MQVLAKTAKSARRKAKKRAPGRVVSKVNKLSTRPSKGITMNLYSVTLRMRKKRK